MISFRYHIVTIVAVFLALAIGLLAGSAFVEPELVDQLRVQTDRLTGQLRDVEGQLSETRAEVASLDAFADAALPHLLHERLSGTTAVIIAQDGVEEAVVDQTERALTEGGAEVVALVSTLPSLASQDPDTRSQLAEILGAEDPETESLPSETASALARRLANGGDGAAPEDDVLGELLSAGFLDTDGSEGTLEQIGVPGQVVVVLGGGPSETPPLPPEAFAVPLVDELAALEMPAAAGESATTVVPFVESVRGTDGIVTVDDLDLSIGGAALVLGLDQLLTTGQSGAYGIKDGADPLPPAP